MARDLRKKRGPIDTAKFSFEDSKTYLYAVAICFHILPLFFAFTEWGQGMLTTVFWTTLNPILIFIICLVHGMRLGFCFKFPLITGVLSGVSPALYYAIFASSFLVGFFVSAVVYTVLALIAELFGGFVKKLIGG